MEHPKASVKLEVIIVGAGIGGLMMALLLEQIGIQYHIFERAAEVKPLGAALVLSVHNLAALEQLGIYEDLEKISKPFRTVSFYLGDGKPLGEIKRDRNKDMFGYDDMAFARPDFYEILRKRIPSEKISFKKKILKTEQKDGKVVIHCSDNSTYIGDMLIGADGAYSGVRQSMYKELESKGLLPKEDLEDFSIGYTVTVGVAKCDPKKYPILEEERGRFRQILFDGDSNCYVVTLPNNQISWGLGTQISREELKEMQFRNSEWSMDSSENAIKPFRDFPSPVGGTMRELFDATPKELISKVYLEEKLFKTWHHGRIVLIGDACHKLHPAGGQGASNALHDAVTLANCIYFMKDSSEKSMKAAFTDYYDQRFKHAAEAYDMSSFMAKILNGQKSWERMLRKFILHYFPEWLYYILIAIITKYRPQVAWLPLVESRGTEKPHPQPFEKKKNSKAVSL
ncbi:hypothetical protein BGZ76_006772 [Entomortierella beljakovae]|nr:hypothetical protein BGZ76_006772 [Entomortierella beljakovae]